VIVTARVTILIISVDRGSTFVFGEKLLDFPVVGPGADRELEIFLGNRIPVLSGFRQLQESGKHGL
jgi:hypothetical protein